MPKKQHRPPTPEQKARLQRELERAWEVKEEAEAVGERVGRERTELDVRVDEYLAELLGQ